MADSAKVYPGPLKTTEREKDKAKRRRPRKPQEFGSPISLRNDPEDAVYGSGMGEAEERPW